MSRNLRAKNPRPSAKVAKRRGSATVRAATPTGLSDDDGYSGVDDISDSEDDEDNVDAAEAEHIVNDESLSQCDSRSPRPLSDGDHEANLDDDSEEDEDDEEDASDADMEDEDGDDDEVGDDPDAADVHVDGASWNGITPSASEGSSSRLSSPRKDAARAKRQVRFDVPPSDSDSDSDSTETDDDHRDIFPDIFVEQSSLDPAFRREVEKDDDDSSSSSAFWDFHGFGLEGSEPIADAGFGLVIHATSPAPPPTASQDLAASDDPLELEGETSEGDTTEEDEGPPVALTPQRQVTRTVAESSDSETPRVLRFRTGKPRIGSFDLESACRKPVVVANTASNKMMIFTPALAQQLDLSPEQFNISFLHQEDLLSPIHSSSASVMFGAVFPAGATGEFLDARAIGPVEAFFPVFAKDATDGSDSDMEEDDGVDEAEQGLRLSDFIDCATSDDERDDSNELGSGTSDPETVRPGSLAVGDGDVLSHLTSGTVGAFRRSQADRRLLLSSKATPDSLAFRSPLNETALRGLRSDRFLHASTPLTPPRRPKRRSMDLQQSPIDSHPQKRKAAALATSSHKRQRSISDVHNLRL